MRSEELAYTAGFFDGEGTIVIGKREPAKKRREKSSSYYLHVSLANTNKNIMEWLTRQFGGSIILKKQGKKNWKPC